MDLTEPVVGLFLCPVCWGWRGGRDEWPSGVTQGRFPFLRMRFHHVPMPFYTGERFPKHKKHSNPQKAQLKQNAITNLSSLQKYVR